MAATEETDDVQFVTTDKTTNFAMACRMAQSFGHTVIVSKSFSQLEIICNEEKNKHLIVYLDIKEASQIVELDNPFIKIIACVSSEFGLLKEDINQFAGIDTFVSGLNAAVLRQTIFRQSHKPTLSPASYLLPNSRVRIETVTGDKPDAIEKMRHVSSTHSGIPDTRSLQRATAIAEELILNAPGNPVLHWGTDGVTFAVMVEDSTGSLRKVDFFDGIWKSKLQLRSLGHGLKIALENSHTIVAQVFPGIRSNVLCLFSESSSNKEHHTTPKSIQFYVG